MNLHLKDPASALTHFVGAVLSVVGLVALLYKAVAFGTLWHVISFAVFGLSLTLLYSASTIYHALDLSPELTLILRKIDHIMIFVLIAGTYTPFCLLPLRGVWGWSIFGAIWALAILGLVMSLFWIDSPRWLSTGIYVLMGWLIIIAIYPLSQAVTGASLTWLVVGGVLYTGGAVLYATKWPNPWPGKFGFHEIWHLFVMAGSLAHFLSVWALL